MDNKPRTPLPNWVQEQQHQSWQIEILIASGLIFFLTNIPQYLGDWFADYEQATTVGAESVILVIGALYFSRVLLIGFVINLSLRALWLAYLGINFVYPNDINYKQLNYSDFFKEKMEKRSDSVERIIQLEHLSSLAYSITVMLTVMAFGIFLLLSVFFSILRRIAPQLYDSQDFGVVIMVFFMLFSLGLLDFLFFRAFKRSKRMSRWYYPIYSFYSFVSLSFLFKREWLVLISNGKRWIIYPVFIFFFVIAFFMTADDVDRYVGDFEDFTLNLYETREFLDIPTYNGIRSNQYNNLLRPDEKIETWCISSDVIREKSTWVFVVYNKSMDNTLERVMEGYDFQKGNFRSREEVFANDRKFSASISEFLSLKIDSTAITGNAWFYHKHPVTGEKGFKTYIALDSVSPGHHLIHLDRLNFVKDTSFFTPLRSAAFFKE
ncbi:MAG: hypothetical protein KTR30_24500 [Saprospiraceae bacterium]|nr:hypothetical protein [Saprospiraceae bacterium]